VNASPDDAKWIFRWSQPDVPYPAGNLDGIAGTRVKVLEY
jgi:hypothetical protein